jgi:predicted ATPase/DNA-binding CsgD family transcriptional regulator
VTSAGRTFPVELTSFVGRAAELSAAGALLRSSRLLTLTGVGGSGKTRLAAELASGVAGEFRHGVTFVELAPVVESALIGQTVAQALGLIESSHRDADDAVEAALRDAESLLLLDNCEHLIERCAVFAERMLKRCPGMRFLTTSRQPLGVSGEVVFAVPPMALPPLEGTESTRAALESDAVRLLAERATSARPGFAIDASNAELGALICHRLDGLPLAIELAAALFRSLAPEEILARLDDRLGLLVHAPRTADSRHQTLRATIDWSHELLSVEERILFRRLSVFAGGWYLDDAEAVCSDRLLPRQRILEAHAQLVDKSLVVGELTPIGRFRHKFLEAVREYSRERLDAAHEADRLRRHHFDRFLSVAEAYYLQRTEGGSDAGLARLAADRDNFRAALTWSERADPEGALRLTSALDDFWRMVSGAEGWNWLQRTLPLVSKASPHRMRALLTAGWLSAYVPAYSEGAGLVREALAAAQLAGNRAAEAWAETCLGRLAFFSNEPLRGREHLERALSTHAALHIPLGTVRALCLLGLMEALMLGRSAEGEAKLEHALVLAGEIGDSWGEGYANLMLGITASDANQHQRAVKHSRAALAVPGLGPVLGVPLVSLARVAAEDDPARALRLLGAATAHFERTGTTAPPFVTERAAAARQRAERLIGSRAGSRAYAEGRAMSSEEAFSFALGDAADEPVQRPGGLSRRELQVAALVGRQQTNREIAAALVISVRTAESHVDHILAKLGLSNRNELSAWARGNGLVSTETAKLP